MERPIGFLLRLVDGLIDEQFAATLDEHGVTRRQWQLLNVLDEGPATAVELDAAVAPFATGDDGASSSDHLAELVESEWVASSDSGFVLTPRGKQSLDKLTEVVDGLRSRLSAGIADSDYETTTATLELMARNLGWVDEG